MLPGSYRLKKRSDFSRAYHRGQAKACADFVLFRYHRRGPQTRIGFSASKKLGHAVIRNRLKRLFRHASFANLEKFSKGWDYIFVIRQPALTRTFSQIEAQIIKMLKEQ